MCKNVKSEPMHLEKINNCSLACLKDVASRCVNQAKKRGARAYMRRDLQILGPKGLARGRRSECSKNKLCMLQDGQEKTW